KPGAVVLEPFCGSGSQLIAAEKLGRRCRAMEIAPAFVDGAILRWQTATGKQATLDGDGRTFTEVRESRGQQPGLDSPTTRSATTWASDPTAATPRSPRSTASASAR